MKKALVLSAAVLSLSICFTGCGGSGSSAATSSAASAGASVAASSAAPAVDSQIAAADSAPQGAARKTGTAVTTVSKAVQAESSLAQGGGDATLKKFNQIKEGMTYDEVKTIMGSEGTKSVGAANAAATVEIYSWAGSTPGTTANVSFTDGKVTAMNQVGLS